MARDRKDLGSRKFVRVDLRKRGFLIPAAAMLVDLAQGRTGRRPIHLRPGAAQGCRAGRRAGGRCQEGARLESFSVLMNQNRALDSCFDAFS